MTSASPTSITALGAAGTVTGSKFLLRHRGATVLFDCGMFQGGRDLRQRNWDEFDFDPAGLDAVVISHAHLDHCGLLPRLVREGFRGTVHATSDTSRLMSVVLPDSGRIHEEDARHANRAGYSRHEPALPLYTEDDAWTALDLVRSRTFDQRFTVADGVHVTFSPAGHILGSAVTRIELDDGPTIVFSGDLGRPNHPLLVAPTGAGRCDHLFVESTYGNREHMDEDSPQRLAELITRTVDRGGTVVIPSFAVDRTEVLLYHLRQLHTTGELPDVPIFVDSPMALAALRIYYDAFEQFAADVRPELHDNGELFDLPTLQAVHDVEGSKMVSAHRDPAIIIAGAGMATGGRVVHHLKQFLPGPENSVALVGYQSVGTRGRQLLDGAGSVKIHGQYVRVRAEVCDLSGFSVHADASELVDWVGTADGEPAVYAIHGEPDAATALRDTVEARFDLVVAVPAHGERIVL